MAETEVMLPPGPKVAFIGGYKCNDHAAIRAALDRVHAKHPGTVLLHGGAPKGAERIAACRANARKVPQVAFRPDFTRRQTAVPFKSNGPLPALPPIGVVVFFGSESATTSPARRRNPAFRCSISARGTARKRHDPCPSPFSGRTGRPFRMSG